jgi:hypothetical protein
MKKAAVMPLASSISGLMASGVFAVAEDTAGMPQSGPVPAAGTSA